MLFGLLLALLPSTASLHFVDGRIFFYRYLYTGYLTYSFPSFPYLTSGRAIMRREFVYGKVIYLLYDDNIIFDLFWTEF
jgi:hypothetical protein